MLKVKVGRARGAEDPFEVLRFYRMSRRCVDGHAKPGRRFGATLAALQQGLSQRASSKQRHVQRQFPFRTPTYHLSGFSRQSQLPKNSKF